MNSIDPAARAMKVFAEGIEVGFLVTRSERLWAQWWEYCEVVEHAFVLVWARPRWCSVKLDTSPARRYLTADQEHRLNRVLLEAARKAFASGARGYIHASAGLDFAGITKVRSEDALGIAKMLLNEALRAPVRSGKWVAA